MSGAVRALTENTTLEKKSFCGVNKKHYGRLGSDKECLYLSGRWRMADHENAKNRQSQNVKMPNREIAKSRKYENAKFRKLENAKMRN